jgi:hypothetical protein
VEFRCHDTDDARCDYLLRAVDARSGETLHHFSLVFCVIDDGERGSQVQTFAKNGTATVPSIAGGMRFEWMLSAKGYVPGWGEETSFPNEGARRTLTVELEPGWGTQFLAVDAEDRPLEGARVFLDGEDQGGTDARGLLRVRRGERPAKASIVYRDWVLKRGDVDRKTSALKEQIWGARVVLGPPE